MLAAALDPKTTPEYHALNTVELGIRIQPGVNPRILRRAFNGLVKRHDSLRLRLVNRHDEWMAEILDEHPTGLIVEDFGPVDLEGQAQEIQKICAVPKTALDEALFEMRLLKFGGHGDVVLIRAQHTIIDGYSIALMLEELLGLVVGIPSVRPAISHGEFIAHREAGLQMRAAEKEQYWQESLLPLPAPQKVGRYKLGLPPASRQTMGKSVKSENILSDVTRAHLAEQAKATGLSTFCHLHAAFAEAICEAGGGDQALFLCMLGRQDARLAGFIGAEMQALRLKYHKGSGAAGISELISRGSDMMPSSVFDPGMPLSGLEFQFFVNMPTPMGRLRSSPFRKLFDQAFRENIKLGIFSMERVVIEDDAETEFDLQLKVSSDEGGGQASLIADAAAWTSDDLALIAEIMEHQVKRVS